MRGIKKVCSAITIALVVWGCVIGAEFTNMNFLPVFTQDVIYETEVDVVTSAVASQTFSSYSVESVDEILSKVSSNKKTNSTVPSKTTSSVVSSKVTSSAVSSVKKPVVVKKETNNTEIVTYTKRPTYSSIQKELTALAKKYPELIQLSSIGTSVQGRKLSMICLGKGKTKALVVGGFHARESITVSYVMRCIEEFCVAYESKSGKFDSFDMVNLLENYTLYIVPLVNPDGLEIIGGRDKPEVKINYRGDMTISDYKANANGVNLNKNFPLLWNKINNKVTLPDPEGYKGPSAGSEPETKALMTLCKQHNFEWMTSMHVRGDCVYWSDSLNLSVGKSSTIVNQLKERCDFYKCNTSTDINGYGGGFENWFRNEFKRPGLCVELMPLTIGVTPLSNSNHASFSNTVRWNSTKKVLPLVMIYGFPN